jgi:putative DNA primase/helicase
VNAGPIPFLPDSWLESLQADKWQQRNVNEYATRAELQEWLESRTGAASEPCAKLESALAAAMEELDAEAEAAHDIMNRRVYHLLALAHEDHSGILSVMDQCLEQYIYIVHERRMENRKGDEVEREPRGPREAYEEFMRSRDGAIRILMVDQEVFPSCYCLADPERPEDENALGYHAEYRDPSTYRDSDLGLAQMFFDLHRWDFCWLTEEERWILWDGVTWKRDANLQIQRMAWSVGERFADATLAMGAALDKMEAQGADPDAIKVVSDKMKNLAGKAKAAEDLPRVKRFIETARALPNVARSISAFDTDPRALGVRNGVLELSADGSVKLRAGTRGDRITRSTRVDYVPGATHKELTKFLRTFVPDTAVRRYLQKFLGYSLLGTNSERKIGFFIGASSSGKSTLLEAVIAMMGEYGGPLPLSIFHSHNADRPRPDIIAAKPRRIIQTSELDAKTPLHADALKRLISTDTQSVRGMHKDVYDEREHSFTPFIASNVTPSIPNADTGFKQRLAVFPFNHSLVGTGKIDPRAGERLRSDEEILTALLAWMVEGYEMYAVEGLDGDVPKVMLDEVDKFMAGTNHFQQWFLETFIKDRDGWLPTERIWQAYEVWCDTQSIPSQERLNEKRSLPAALEDAGFKKAPKVRRVGKEVLRVRTGYRFRGSKEVRQW